MDTLSSSCSSINAVLTTVNIPSLLYTALAYVRSYILQIPLIALHISYDS